MFGRAQGVPHVGCRVVLRHVGHGDRHVGVDRNAVAGNLLRHTLSVLIAAAYWDRRRCGSEDPIWTVVGMYTRGRLLAPPRSG